MNVETLQALIEKTRNNIKEFEEKIFKEHKSDYSIYRAETSIYLGTLNFLEGLLNYSLNADEIEAIEKNLNEMNATIEKDLNKTQTESNTYNTVNDFNKIDFDSISQEVNNTQQDYSSIEQFMAN